MFSAAHTSIFPLFLCVWLAIPRVLTASVNRTIDDFYGDPITRTYVTFDDGWSFCANCANRRLPPSGAFDATYSVSEGPNVTIHFVGTAIYFFSIADGGFNKVVNWGAALDTNPIETGSVAAVTTDTYHFPIFSKTGLTNASHTLKIGPVPPFSDNFIFDYAIYTFDEPDPVPPPPPRPKKLAGPIAGGVVGGLVLLLALAFLVYRVRRRRQTKTPVFPTGIDDSAEKQPAVPWPSRPLPRSAAPTTDFIQEEWTPELASSAVTTLPSGETQLSLSMSDRSVPSQVLKMEEKQRRARREEAERQIELLQQEIRQLTEAEARAAESVTTSTPRHTVDMDTSAELMAVRAEMMMLKERMDAMQQQQMPEPPKYTAGGAGPSSAR